MPKIMVSRVMSANYLLLLGDLITLLADAAISAQLTRHDRRKWCQTQRADEMHPD